MGTKFTLHFLGAGHKPLFKANSKLPHPDMVSRNEFNVHVFGYRLSITWR